MVSKLPGSAYEHGAAVTSVISPIRAGHYHIDTADLLYGLNAELTSYARQTIVPGFIFLFFQFTVPAADMGTSEPLAKV